jgi:hypothetical protein
MCCTIGAYLPVIQLLFFLSLAVAFFAFLAYFAYRGRAEGGAVVLVEARQALFTLENDLICEQFVSRIFAPEDLEFVNSEHSAAIRRLFLEERKKVALIWVDRVQSQIRQLRHLHLGSARFYAQLDFKTELFLARDFTMLLVACWMLHLAFLVGGAYAAPGMVGNVAAAAGRVCEISRQSLAFLTKTGLDHLGSASAGGPPALKS